MSSIQVERKNIIKSLYTLAHDYEVKRNIYWTQYRKLRNRSHCLSIPLLILTSFTAATSSAQASAIDGYMRSLSIVISVFGVSSAVLTALQKYMRYAERAESSKYISKMYGLIASKVKGQIELILAGHNLPTQEEFNEFLDDINREAQSLQLEIDVVPDELIRYDQDKYIDSLEKDDFDDLISNRINQYDGFMFLNNDEKGTSEGCEIIVDK